jgi:hypothetical protein
MSASCVAGAPWGAEAGPPPAFVFDENQTPPQWAIFEPCFRRIRRSDVALATASTRIRNMEEVLGVPLLTRPRK